MGERVPLLGRTSELALLEGLIEDAPRAGAGLVVAGAPGVGKSALLDWAGAAADDRMHVLRATGSPSEFDLPFAGLHRLVRPVLGHAERLSAHRREALEVACGVSAGMQPDLFTVAMATVDLLGEAASRRPLLVLADDAHWFDLPTQRALAFVLRRIASDPIVVLAARRLRDEGPLSDPTFPVVELGPLDPVSAGELLDRVAAVIDPPTRRRLLEIADGNPLALLELPRSLVDPEDASDAGRLPLTTRLERSFASRVADLDPVGRRAVGVAVLNDSDDLGEVLAATELLTGTRAPAALDAAATAGLLSLGDDTVRFEHPLVRSAVHQRLSPTERRLVHAALADVLDGDVDRVTWHRAAAALQPEPVLADALEDLAERALRRGATTAAADALQRSAELTSGLPLRQTRLHRAAVLAYAAGRTAQGDRLRGIARALIASDLDRLRYEWLCELAGTDRGGEQRIDLLMESADAAHLLDDDDLAAQFLRAAASRCWNFCPGRPIGRSVIAAADRLPVGDVAQRASLVAYGAPLESADEVLGLIAGVKRSGRDATTAYRLGHAAACVGAFDVSEALLSEAVDGLRSEGRLHTLGRTLVLQSWSALRRGDWPTAVSSADEGSRLCAESDQPFWQACGVAAHATIAAQRGDLGAATELVGQADRIAAPHHFAAADAVILIARAALATVEGQHDHAFALLARIHDPADVAHHPIHGLWSVAHLADAAAMCGEVAAARRILDGFRAEVRATRSPAGRVNLVAATALLADGQEMEEAMRDALRVVTGAWPFERNRLLFAFGSWLRRGRRTRESREYFREARDGFERLGAGPAAERAREELRAAGEQSDPPAGTDAWSGLSPQEMQIASMVMRGMTNREIGERLFLSHRTVGSHLYRMFPKLGITSRIGLLRLAAERDRQRR